MVEEEDRARRTGADERDVNPHRLSGSKLGLAANCLYWARLDAEQAPKQTIPEAALGLAFHQVCEWMINPGPHDSYGEARREDFWKGETSHHAEIAKDAMALWKVDASELQTLLIWIQAWKQRYTKRDGWRAEVSYAFNPETGEVRELGVSIGRKYKEHGCPDGWIPMTADLVVLVPNADNHSLQKVIVGDWKTGRQENTPPARVNPQLRALAACVAKVHAVAQVTVLLSHVTNEGVHEDAATLDDFELSEVIPSEIKVLYDGVPNAKPVAGGHCSGLFCSSAGACPATRAAAEMLLPEDPSKKHLPVVGRADAITSPDHARAIWHRLKAIEAMMDAAWQALDDYVDEHGAVVLDETHEYRRCEETRESIVVDKDSLDILRDRLGEKADLVIKTKITKEALKEQSYAIAGAGRPGGAFLRETLSLLRAKGCVRESQSVSHERVKQKKRVSEAETLGQ